MIEKKFITEKLKEFQIQEYIETTLRNVGHSHTKLQKTPLGEKIIIYAARPGLIVGKKGENIKKLTTVLKKRFKLESPQIEISEVENPNLDATIVAEKIASALEKFGTNKFKAIGHKALQEVMGSGALGIEIRISGKVPSARAKSWRFYQGYLKKSGDIALEGVRTAHASAQLKSGTIGIKVKIMPPGLQIPDRVQILEPTTEPQKTPEENKQTQDKQNLSENNKTSETTETKKKTRKKSQKKETTEAKNEA